MKVEALSPVFVEFIPEALEDGKLYVSMSYGTAVHRCCCGCGQEVVTPLSPTDWRLTFDGERISLHPSIGNWSFPCRSHYWIRENRIRWAEQWSASEVEAGRNADRIEKERHYSARRSVEHAAPEGPAQQPRTAGFWSRVRSFFRR